MISIGTNASALMAQAATASVQIDAETAMQRLSSGKRINAAKDDAAGVAIASRLTSHVRGLHQSIRNSMDAQALISTAEGGLQETEVLLQRIRELAVQASNDTNSDADRTNLNNEAQQLLAGIDAIACLAVNDAHVMLAWAEQKQADGLIDLLADSRAVFSDELGLTTDMGPVLGIRASRSALIIEDGVITHFFKEAPKAFEVSDAESLLAIVSG